MVTSVSDKGSLKVSTSLVLIIMTGILLAANYFILNQNENVYFLGCFLLMGGFGLAQACVLFMNKSNDAKTTISLIMLAVAICILIELLYFKLPETSTAILGVLKFIVGYFIVTFMLFAIITASAKNDVKLQT